MLDLIKKIREELIADTTITAYVDQRIYWEFNPQGNTEKDYPQITMESTQGSTDSLTNVYSINLFIHIWTKGSSRLTTANQIAKQILLQIDKKSYLNTSPCIYQLWKTAGVDLFEDGSQTLHKVLTFNVEMDGYE